MIKKLYTKYFKNKFFNRIFIIYSAISIISILVVAFTTSKNVSISLQQKEREYNGQVLNIVDRYLEQKLSESRNTMQQIYINSSMYAEIDNLMKNGYNEHLAYKLDRLSKSHDTSYNGFEKYFESIMSNTKDTLGISIYSKDLKQFFIYSDILRTSGTGMLLGDIDKAMPGIWGRKILPAHEVNYYTEKENPRAFTVVYPVIDRFSPDITGFIAFDYDITALNNLVLNQVKFKGNVVIYTDDGQVLFDYEGKYQKKQPSEIEGLINSNNGDIISTKTFDDPRAAIIAITPRSQMVKGTSLIIQTIFLVSLACILGAVFLVFLTMITFSKRIKLIMHGFKRVRNGDLSARIPVNHTRDEISEMAADFNSMCDEVESYIQKIYVSEIKQKTAELKALQAQINPHFLYNTLEAIRMRAAARGVNEVADMIYILSELQRRAVKGKTVVSIREELEYSEMYIELFRLRYAGTLSVDFDVHKQAVSCGIIKHSIQPLIENCIKHAANMAREGNHITIKIYKENKELYIHIIDNGKGIDKERLYKIKKSLYDKNTHEESGLGLVNVNERIKLIYGRNYGIDIISEPGKGTEVIMRIPAKTKEELEADVQSIHS